MRVGDGDVPFVRLEAEFTFELRSRVSYFPAGVELLVLPSERGEAMLDLFISAPPRADWAIADGGRSQ
jgi:uncharacterized protein (DUF58 family)